MIYIADEAYSIKFYCLVTIIIMILFKITMLWWSVGGISNAGIFNTILYVNLRRFKCGEISSRIIVVKLDGNNGQTDIKDHDSRKIVTVVQSLPDC